MLLPAEEEKREIKYFFIYIKEEESDADCIRIDDDRVKSSGFFLSFFFVVISFFALAPSVQLGKAIDSGL